MQGTAAAAEALAADKAEKATCTGALLGPVKKLAGCTASFTKNTDSCSARVKIRTCFSEAELGCR